MQRGAQTRESLGRVGAGGGRSAALNCESRDRGRSLSSGEPGQLSGDVQSRVLLCTVTSGREIKVA